MPPPPVLVDTNVISYIRRNDSRGEEYRRMIEQFQRHLSVVSVGELKFGAYKAGWSARRTADLMRVIDAYIIVDIDADTADLWARVRATAEAMGRPIPVADAWIAASALALNCPLVTHNPRDFSAVPDLELISYA